MFVLPILQMQFDKRRTKSNKCFLLLATLQHLLASTFVRMRTLLFGLAVIVLNTACSSQDRIPNECDPPPFQLLMELLKAYVDDEGFVDYSGFAKDSIRLNEYCRILSDCPPNSKWSKEEKLAYWINVYNAFTIKLIVDHYPVASIKDIKKGIPFINSVWDMEFFEIGGVKMDLNDVEHDILRKEFDEPRIHFAIVCASKSCPQLRNEAYTSALLNVQLETQTKKFFNDTTKNRIGNDRIELSPIFKWFKKDFTRSGTLHDWVKEYYKGPTDENAKITYMDYDWSLNGK